MQFQTGHLREQAGYYKTVAKQQRNALKAQKAELASLRELKRSV
jgi:hypothetical protein